MYEKILNASVISFGFDPIICNGIENVGSNPIWGAMKYNEIIKKLKSRDSNLKIRELNLNSVEEISLHDSHPENPIQLNENEQKTSTEFTYTWSVGHSTVMHAILYIMHEYLSKNSDDLLMLRNEGNIAFEYELGKTKSVVLYGNGVYSIDNKLVSFNTAERFATLKSNYDLSKIIEDINYNIKHNDIYAGNNFSLLYDSVDGFKLKFLNINNVKLENVVLDVNSKNDIIDNTIFHLNNLDGSNGLILHGPPGVGKSLVCSAIALEANISKIPTITVTSEPNFSFLKEVIDTFFTKCIVFLEDIDGIAESRDNSNNSRISDLLQFINGIGDMDTDVVFVATTNYLEYLDDAIKNRPVRFNRIIEIPFPDEQLIKTLFSKYVGSDLVDIYGKHCKSLVDRKTTGSHIREISRTAKMLSKKNNKELRDVLEDSIEIVNKSFSTTIESSFGFKQ